NLPDALGKSRGSGQERSLPLGKVVRAIIQRRAYVRVVLLTMGFWVIVSQITLTVPLQSERLFGTKSIGILLGLNSFLAIPLQYPLVRFLARRLGPMSILAWSYFLTGAGLAMVFFAPTFAWQIAGIIIATAGTLAVGPTLQSITAQVAPPGGIGAFYG